MIKFVVGNILESKAECLVNTVNCEGFMGKGIAYQFKQKFPNNYLDYKKACVSGALRIGTLHHFREGDKFIVNFPTKNKWRGKSKFEYIYVGLEELVRLLSTTNVSSIAIPPLGCGNGGLSWYEVKPVILDYLSGLEDQLDIIIYEPSKYSVTRTVEPPKLTTSHLVLMEFKLKLVKFNRMRIQKASYFLELFSGTRLFRFNQNEMGPHDTSLDKLMKEIKEFQEYHNLETEAALEIAKATLISESVEQKVKNINMYMEKAASFVNRVRTDKELDLLATISFVIQNSGGIDERGILSTIRRWSEEKTKKYPDGDVSRAIQKLIEESIVVQDIFGAFVPFITVN